MMIKVNNTLLTLYTIALLTSCAVHQPAPVESLSTKVATPQNLTVISGNTYTVQAGDTLFAIAFYSGNDYQDLARINNIPAPYTIKIGQNINLVDPKSTNKTKQNIALGQGVQNSDKIEVDPKDSQAYGVGKAKKHRKNQKEKSKSSNKPYNKLAWIWPATGSSTVATVGSDGSKRGLDIKGQLGSTIKAAADGKVVYAGNALKGYGNLIIVKHNDEYLSAYAHNRSILVSEQSYVTQGQKIATMGNSGASETMLHFEIRKKGQSIDPFKYLPSR